jgi:hypothetical protein
MMVTATRMPAGVSQSCQVATASSRRYHCEDQLADETNAPPVEAIGDVADNEGQNTIGRNWQRPTRARAKALWVWS